MKDLWGECYSGEHQGNLSPEQFKQTFCRVCRNGDCRNSVAGSTLWSHRMRTQQDVLLDNPQFADPEDPRHEHLRGLDFQDMLRQAMALEISAQRGDWEIPSTSDVLSLAMQMSGRPVGFQEPEPVAPEPEEPEEPVAHVLWEGEADGSKGKTYNVTLASVDGGEPSWSCSCPSFIYGKASPEGCKHILDARSLYEAQQKEIEYIEEEEARTVPQAVVLPPQGVAPERWQQMRERHLIPANPNTRFPSEGVMVDGSAPPPEAPAADPWAVPSSKPTGKIVAVHGKVVLGGAKPPSEDT